MSSFSSSLLFPLTLGHHHCCCPFFIIHQPHLHFNRLLSSSISSTEEEEQEDDGDGDEQEFASNWKTLSKGDQISWVKESVVHLSSLSLLYGESSIMVRLITYVCFFSTLSTSSSLFLFRLLSTIFSFFLALQFTVSFYILYNSSGSRLLFP